MKIEQDWLHAPALRRVTDALSGAGAQVRVVGGAVRDALAGRPVGDIDLATTLPPAQVSEAVIAAGLKAVPTGLKHGTITAVALGQPFEITTLRRDVRTDGRHADVEFTTDWQEDAARRDFTINAMSCTLDGEVSDYFTGLEDLKAGRVRFVGNPLQRIREDVLRILRFFRFHAHFGQGDPDPAGYMAASMLAPLLGSLSRERARNELLKLLAAPAPAMTWQAMIEAGAIHVLDLPLGNTGRLEQVAALEVALGRVDPLRRLYAVVNGDGDINVLAQGLRLSNAQMARLQAMRQSVLLSGGGPALLRHAYWRGALGLADCLVLSGQATAEALAALEAFRRPEFPLGGEDLIRSGIPKGPRLGELLRRVEEWWVEQDFVPDRAACLIHLRSLTT